SLGNDGGRDAGPRQDGAAEGQEWVDHDRTRFVKFALPREGIEAHRYALDVTVNPLQIGMDDLAKGQLPLSGQVDQESSPIHEEVQSVRLELMGRQGMHRPEVALDVEKGGSHVSQGYLVLAANRLEDVGLHQVHERETRLIGLRQADDWPEASIASARG